MNSPFPNCPPILIDLSAPCAPGLQAQTPQPPEMPTLGFLSLRGPALLTLSRVSATVLASGWGLLGQQRNCGPEDPHGGSNCTSIYMKVDP